MKCQAFFYDATLFVIYIHLLFIFQYFATVSPDDSVNLNNIPWLDLSVITGRQAQEKGGFDIADLANIVGSGEAVGGVVTAVVGGANGGSGQDVPQLQRIVARCGCEFYFVNFNAELDPLAESMTPNTVVSNNILLSVLLEVFKNM